MGLNKWQKRAIYLKEDVHKFIILHLKIALNIIDKRFLIQNSLNDTRTTYLALSKLLIQLSKISRALLASFLKETFSVKISVLNSAKMPMLGRFTSTTLSKLEACVHSVIKVSLVSFGCKEINGTEDTVCCACHQCNLNLCIV